jgi:hypothetical protein
LLHRESQAGTTCGIAIYPYANRYSPSLVVAGACMELTLVRAKSFLRLDPDTDDDFDDIHQGKRIGRVQPGASQPWRWSLSQALAVGVYGRAEKRAQAVTSLSQAYANVALPAAVS